MSIIHIFTDIFLTRILFCRMFVSENVSFNGIEIKIGEPNSNSSLVLCDNFADILLENIGIQFI